MTSVSVESEMVSEILPVALVAIYLFLTCCNLLSPSSHQKRISMNIYSEQCVHNATCGIVCLKHLIQKKGIGPDMTCGIAVTKTSSDINFSNSQSHQILNFFND